MASRARELKDMGLLGGGGGNGGGGKGGGGDKKGGWPCLTIIVINDALVGTAIYGGYTWIT